jgi:Dienelactone hydrolase and related enzymes
MHKASTQTSISIATDELAQKALIIETTFFQQNYSSFSDYFDDGVKKYLTKETLEKSMAMIRSEMGSLKEMVSTESQKKGNDTVITIKSLFEKKTADFLVVFNQEQKAMGFYIVNPITIKDDYLAPKYVIDGSFSDEDIEIGSGEWKLPGSLSVPKGNAKHPAVILVHGSGPNDRNESIGPNEPFKDIAWGLASKGIAALRYEKRTRFYSNRIEELLPGLTVKEEVIDDVVSAYEFLERDPRIDVSNIYILGHSLGGMLIPRIARQLPSAAGYIAMAAPMRPLQMAFLDQVEYLQSIKITISDADKDAMSTIKEAVQKINKAVCNS